ncbi:MAG TPA: biotin-dependent carboxyltransferase family protein [Xanthobacteraceae bacterium]|jgi:biotin-dependent carboxylase-like uncharacterized protein
MTPALHVVTPGLWTTVQDLGRPGFQHLGIPVGGALDPISLRAANLLVGNEPGAAALEVAYLGPTLRVEADHIRLSIVGAKAAVEILPDVGATSGERIEALRSARLRRGEVLRIGALTGGSVLYVAVERGFAIAPVLGSVSTCVRGGFGGWQGRKLMAGDRLPLCKAIASAREDVRLEGFDPATPRRLRVIPGPQNELFSEQDLATFFAHQYTVSAHSDRVGMRLIGPALAHNRGSDLISDAVAPGSIQIPGGGQPIVALADRQTTGGYPKIATVISADLPALGRLAAGATIGFEPVTLELAEAARRQLLGEIASLHQRIVPLRRSESAVSLAAPAAA